MANELRRYYDWIGGLVEDNPLASGATTLTSAGLAALPAVGSTEHVVVVFDPDGLEGAPFTKYITAHTAGATTATITAAAQEGTTTRAVSRDIPWVHTFTRLDGNGSGLIGITSYNPSTLQTIVPTTSIADVDATNLKIDFVVPPSGKVLFILNAMARMETASKYLHWLLRESSTEIARQAAVREFTSESRVNARILVTGLTPGDAKTYKWAHVLESGSGGATKYGGTGTPGTSAGAATMEAWAVNS